MFGKPFSKTSIVCSTAVTTIMDLPFTVVSIAANLKPFLSDAKVDFALPAATFTPLNVLLT